MILLDPPQHRLVCPNCEQTGVWIGDLPRPGLGMSQMHACRGLRGLNAPLVPEGTDCAVEAIEREDYVNGELVQRDGEGRPVMAIITRYGDGRSDCAVLAPTAGRVA